MFSKKLGLRTEIIMLIAYDEVLKLVNRHDL